ncbi:MAG: ABC transporter substrate-binding protein [Syntrophales bacterium]|nr:ABC transporter substrate-binding protein [Syntrophales bacterium]
MMAKSSRKKVFWFTYLMTFLIAVGFAPIAPAAEKGPIKLAVVAPITGSRAQVGGDIVAGFKMRLEEAGYTAAGRKIELIVEDEKTPTAAVNTARKLTTLDNVSFIAGFFATNVAYAMLDVTKKANVPMMITASNGNETTQHQHDRTVFRSNVATSQVSYVAGDYAYKKLGWRNAAVIGWEHAFGQESVGAFQRVFEQNGGKVVERIYVPRETLDFGPYASSLKMEGADGLFAVITAAPSLRFLKALKTTGIMDKWKILMILTGTDESFLQELGDTGLGVLSVNNWSPSLDTPTSKAFVKKAAQMTKREVSGPMMDTYVSADFALRAIEAIKGDVENKQKFLDALWAVEIKDTPHGPIKLDKYGNPNQNIYIRRVDKVGGRYQNTVIDAYENVSQFWSYDPESILKAPAYSKNNPPCKYCR